MTLWDSPRQREAYEWFGVELANLRTAFRWAADQSDLDAAAGIAGYAGILGYLVENYLYRVYRADRSGGALQRRRPAGSRE
jgi:hypothetical protein